MVKSAIFALADLLFDIDLRKLNGVASARISSPNNQK